MLHARIDQHLQTQGSRLREGTIVDCTLIAAPASTKNLQRAGDPEMHLNGKGQNWTHGMKLHIGVDVVSGLVHSLMTTLAIVHDLTLVTKLQHGTEPTVLGDAGYQWVHKGPEHKDGEVEWQVALRAAHFGAGQPIGPDRAGQVFPAT